MQLPTLILSLQIIIAVLIIIIAISLHYKIAVPYMILRISKDKIGIHSCFHLSFGINNRLFAVKRKSENS